MEKSEQKKIAQERGWTLDYLSGGNPIFQCKSEYTFTSDSILLAHAVSEEQIDCLVDLCAGSGVVGLEIVGTKQVKKLIGVEINKNLFSMYTESAKLAKRGTEFQLFNRDVKDCAKFLTDCCADVVVVNPPYFKIDSGYKPTNYSRLIARHEELVDLKTIIEIAHKLLKKNGNLYIVHLHSRENEIRLLALEYNFQFSEQKILDGKLKRVIVKLTKN